MELLLRRALIAISIKRLHSMTFLINPNKEVVRENIKSPGEVQSAHTRDTPGGKTFPVQTGGGGEPTLPVFPPNGEGED